MRLNYPERMSNPYTLAKDLHDRLDGTVCRYDGEIVRVSCDPPKVYLYDYLTGDHLKKIDPDDPLFDISMIETGYFNTRYKNTPVVGYIIRDPLKKYKAALYPSYVKYLNIEGKQLETYLPAGLFCQGVLDMLRGVYPTLGEAYERLDTSDRVVAISKEVALRRDEVGATYVFYRCTPVAWRAPGETKLHLVDNEIRWVAQRHLARIGLEV